MARLANALVVLRSQINDAFPNRSKASDGWIGNSEHSARVSDHNPGPDGVVEAVDITHDPAHFDAHKWVRTVLVPSADRRIKYVISNGQIWSPDRGWHKYDGANPHNHHIHISVKPDPAAYDDERPWRIVGKLEVKLIVKGNTIQGAFRTEDGTTMVPVRALSQALGFTVNFDEPTNTVTVLD